jgi:hypothetical protein
VGRHSVPDDDEDGGVLLADDDAAAVAVDAAALGRHARRDGAQVPGGEAAGAAPRPPAAPVTAPGTQSTAPVAEAVPPASPAGRVRKGDHSTAADLRLLRAHSDVRARVIAAVVAPFVIYTVAVYLAGALDAYVIWVWLPLITAGVLAGSVLDAAHRKRDGRDDGATG